jgi:hypothetical protein
VDDERKEICATLGLSTIDSDLHMGAESQSYSSNGDLRDGSIKGETVIHSCFWKSSVETSTSSRSVATQKFQTLQEQKSLC